MYAFDWSKRQIYFTFPVGETVQTLLFKILLKADLFTFFLLFIITLYRIKHLFMKVMKEAIRNSHILHYFSPCFFLRFCMEAYATLWITCEYRDFQFRRRGKNRMRGSSSEFAYAEIEKKKKEGRTAKTSYKHIIQNISNKTQCHM